MLDQRLSEVAFVAGAVSIADFPNMQRWYETMMARPATKRGFEVALS